MTDIEFLKLALDTSSNGAFPASTEGGGCAYLTDSGLKCPVGLTIPDGHPAQHASCYADELYELFPDLKEHIPSGMSEADMVIIQAIHDQMSRDLGWDHIKFQHELMQSLPRYKGAIELLDGGND